MCKTIQKMCKSFAYIDEKVMETTRNTVLHMSGQSLVMSHRKETLHRNSEH